ncbi:hypothetical protein, partial [Zavarzinia sp.]|uniref:hypothetical protein n=1 Tax=Zavarzinia sp. TaxID=2027920 RepID=UPI003BB4F90B
GLAAHAAGQYREAATEICAALPRIELIGGSRAQRDLFVQTYVDACLKSGQTRDLAALLSERARRRPTVARHFRDLARLARIEGAIPRAVDAEHRAEALARSYAV